ncbi:MAG: hypothetical protein U0520_00275 [Candidatus Saccharimonadales bacterium]
MIQSIQKIIKIGSSAGVTIPAKDLKQQNLSIGDEVEVVVLSKQTKGRGSNTSNTMDVARGILERYKTDFKNLSER